MNAERKYDPAGADLCSDTVVRIGGSQIQHGPFNRRVYLMKLDRADLPGILSDLESLAVRNGYTKIFAKAPSDALMEFVDRGYGVEATIPGYYNGKQDAVFLARYLEPGRAVCTRRDKIAEVLSAALGKARRAARRLPDPYTCRRLSPEHVPELAALYRSVFATYPFPIYDKTYLRSTMRSHVVYYGVFEHDRLVAASSAECDLEAHGAEMTDFATLERTRNRGFARRLLGQMEAESGSLRIRVAYTIARAVSHGMNSTFSRAGYTFAGTLTNNTQIGGRIESMNVWYKRLLQPICAFAPDS